MDDVSRADAAIPVHRARVSLEWILSECGGMRRERTPWEGMRPRVRWPGQVHQRNVDSWDTTVSDLRHAGGRPHGAAVLTFRGMDPEASTLLVVGEQIELMDGRHVIAIGQILALLDAD